MRDAGWKEGCNKTYAQVLILLVLYADFRILVTGGNTVPNQPGTDVSKIYDTLSNSWKMAAPLPEVRTGIASVLLADGRVLVSGGRTSAAFAPNFGDGFVYDPSTNQWQKVAGAMVTARFRHAMTALPDGGALACGGLTGTTGLAPTETCERFYPNPGPGFWATGLQVSSHASACRCPTSLEIAWHTSWRDQRI